MRVVNLAVVSTILLVVSAANAQGPSDTTAEEFESSLRYQRGEVTLGDGLANLHIPEAFRFLGPEDSRRLLVDAWGNPPMNPPLGMLIPSSLSPLSPEGWGVVITFEEDGYVEDDEAEDLDYDEVLADMQKATRQENEQRSRQGYPSIDLVGWATPPHYDAATHKLYWAKELAFGGEEDHTLNYNVRVLGRRGVLVLNAVAGMDQLAMVEKDMGSVMAFVEFNAGHRYTDFVPETDKLATYGIGALVAGKVASKAGLFKVLLAGLVAAKKLVAVAVIGIGVAVRNFLARRKEA